MDIFNLEKLNFNRSKNYQKIIDSTLLQYFAQQIAENLTLFDLNFKNILLINCPQQNLLNLLKHSYPNAQILVIDNVKKLLKHTNHVTKIIVDYENLPFNENSFDLIIFSCGLQWINNVPKFLTKIFNILNQQGIFIANFIGGNSLKNLRLKLMEAEAATSNYHAAHILPFIKFADINYLLKNANFPIHCTNFETVSLKYNNVFNLMRDLKNHGSSNILSKSKYYSITKAMYKFLLSQEAMFEDSLDLIDILACKDKQGIKILK